jgi:hypothetical protein
MRKFGIHRLPAKSRILEDPGTNRTSQISSRAGDFELLKFRRSP